MAAFLCLAGAQTTGFVWQKPAWAPTPVVPPENPTTEAKVKLGRHLFYEKRLSLDGTMSCGTCHEQARAFTDGQPMHVGVTGEMGIRSAMTLTNVAYLPSYTWANPQLTSLEKQMLVPLFSDHPLEMGLQGHDPQAIEALQKDALYRQMFQDAFPNRSIDVDEIVKSIAAFERTLLSFNSPYDRYKHGEPDAIPPDAKRGEALFFGERLECYHCHGGIDFTDNHMQQGQAFPESGFHNTGLYNEDGNGAYKKWDSGLRMVTEKPEDEGKFRTPTLRNIAVTAPYMHDGTIFTLQEVIRKHYAVGSRSALSTHGQSPLRDELIAGFDISDNEVNDLVAFLKTLTDEDFLHNPAFSDPNKSSRGVAESRLSHDR
jgi:cytochrome c peroxidase